VAVLRTLLDPHPGYTPPAHTVSFLLLRELITLGRGVIEITQAGRNMLRNTHH
jgi:hypothetical protein